MQRADNMWQILAIPHIHVYHAHCPRTHLISFPTTLRMVLDRDRISGTLDRSHITTPADLEEHAAASSQRIQTISLDQLDSRRYDEDVLVLYRNFGDPMGFQIVRYLSDVLRFVPGTTILGVWRRGKPAKISIKSEWHTTRGEGREAWMNVTNNVITLWLDYGRRLPTWVR